MRMVAGLFAHYLLVVAAFVLTTSGAALAAPAPEATGSTEQEAPAPPGPGEPSEALSPSPEASPTELGLPDREAQAKQHFEKGIRLYQDKNYAGALAEFEASYDLRPSPSSLQNIALTLKHLFRYAQAADALNKLLERHREDLAPPTRRSVRQTIQELESLVGTVTVETLPTHATLQIDGHRLSQTERSRGIRLNVGEHTLIAEAPGYAQTIETLRIAGGAKQHISLTLEPTHGFIQIVTADRNAAVAVDGIARAYHAWHGPLLPGYHKVQVYREGFEPFEEDVFIELGQTLLLTPELGPPISEPESAAAMSPQAKHRSHGYYGLVALSFTSLDDAPQELDIDGVSSNIGGSFGARAGYRIFSPLGIELLLEAGRHDFNDACDEPETKNQGTNCDAPDAITRNYALDSLRIGGGVRIFSGGQDLRFTSTVGFGMVRHKLTIGPVSEPSLPERKASGVDPYFLAEVGAQYSWNRVLLELNLLAFIDGAGGIQENLEEGETRSIFGDATTVLPMIGLGLRAGWAEW